MRCRAWISRSGAESTSPSWGLQGREIDADESDRVSGYADRGQYYINGRLVSEMNER